MQLRFGARTANGYTTRMFADAWSRYLPKTVEQWNTINKDGDERHLSGVELDTAGFGTGTAWYRQDEKGPRGKVKRDP